MASIKKSSEYYAAELAKDTPLNRAASQMAQSDKEGWEAWIVANKTGGLEWWLDTNDERPAPDRDNKFRATREDIFDWSVEYGLILLRCELGVLTPEQATVLVSLFNKAADAKTAFGAPGDYGYGTKEGDALFQLARALVEAHPVIVAIKSTEQA